MGTVTKPIKLSDHYQNLPNRDLLIGLKVYDEKNGEYLYIKSVDGGLWCGKNKNDEFGHYYQMRYLQYITE